MFRFCRSSNQVDESSSLRLQRNKDCCWDWTCAVFAVSKRKRNVWNQYSVPDSRHRKNIFTPVRDKGIDRCPLCKRMFFTLSRKAGLFNDFQKKKKIFPEVGGFHFSRTSPPTASGNEMLVWGGRQSAESASRAHGQGRTSWIKSTCCLSSTGKCLLRWGDLHYIADNGTNWFTFVSSFGFRSFAAKFEKVFACVINSSFP